MPRRALATLAALATLVACRQPASRTVASARAADSRPDVLLVIFDDLSAEVSLYGGAARTPSLERLAAQGRRFDRAYVQYPLCNPSRTSIFTGWRPERTHVWGNLRNPAPWVRDAVVLQDHFARGGYYTARVGKAYHSRFEREFHWSEAVDTETAEEADAAEWGPSKGDEAALPDVVAAREALRILTAPRSQPVFLVLGIVKPHAPWLVPERYLREYPPASTVLPPSATAPAPSTLHSGARMSIPPEQWREAVAAYRAACTFADAQLGTVLDGLARASRLDRTVVAAIGDNGFHASENGIFGKATLLEPGVRVPLVIAGPGVGRGGQPTTALVEAVDLLPTLVDLAGLPAVPGVDGVSLRPLLVDPGRPVKDAAFSLLKVGAARAAWAGRSVRTDRFRYTLWPDGDEELFDLAADPDSRRNLAADPRHAETRLALRRRLDALPPLTAAPAE
jgi:iduronate 2-sulfatase